MLYPVKKNHLILVFLLLPTLLFFCISCGQSRSANGPNAYTSTHPASGRENNLNSAVDVSPSHVDSLARVKKLTLTSSEWGKAFSFSIIAKYAVLSGSTKFNYSHTSYCLSDTSYTTKDTFDSETPGYDITQACFYFLEKGSNLFVSPIATGAYILTDVPGDTGKPEFSGVSFAIRRGNNITNYSLDARTGRGKITIDYSDEKIVGGSVDVSDGKFSVTGEFDCQLP